MDDICKLLDGGMLVFLWAVGDLFLLDFMYFFFFFSSRRRHTRCREVSWARRCVQETGINAEYMGPFKLEMQSDGNLVLYSGGSKIIWASNSAGKGTAPYHLELQDDGNLVIYDKSHKAVWAIHQNI
eukprot:TRINITY_DN12771_c0_g1_i4.p1 TRINITY_DN12771_c0_g1~~TRINITY_DN12771_c0_g1_i4.p1  ORF type:complete len:127 (+),score=46.03 TRINITY_DN12771_c0_g1_i4:43-423(+)